MATRIQAIYPRAVTINRAALALALSPTVPGAGPAAAQAKTESDTEGAVTATFSYTANKDRTQYRNLKVEINRAGATVLTTTLPRYKDFWPGGAVDDSSVDVRDLDADGEPEVLVKLYSGGANCCLAALVFRYRAATNDYASVYTDYGRYGYTVRNLDGKGPPELVTADIRFSGAFGTVTADQRAPVRILRFEGPVRQRDPLVPGVAEKGPGRAAKDYPQYVRRRPTAGASWPRSPPTS